MAFKQQTPIDMTGLEILNARAHVIAGQPGSPTPGQFWFNSVSGRLEFRGTSGTIDPTARANHLGSQLAATISDFDAQVRTSRLDQLATPATSLDLGDHKIVNLTPGVNGTDAINKAQLDAVQSGFSTMRLDQLASPTGPVSLNGQKLTNVGNGTVATDGCTYGQLLNAINGTDWKPSVRVATTDNLAALSGLQVVDGVTLVAFDRVLVRLQSSPQANGIYVAGAGAWTRAADADVGMLSADAAVFVEEGSLADTQWRITTDGAIAVGTTPITWAQIGAGVSYTNGAGVTLGGNVIGIDTAVVVRKFAQDVGGGATSIAITHNLGTLDVTVGVFEVSSGAEIGCDKVRSSVNVMTLGFAVAPTAGQFRVVIHA